VVIWEWLQWSANIFRKNYSESIGRTEDSARVGGAIIGGMFGSLFSHPMDTAKTCMQGDIERKTYKGFFATYKTLWHEGNKNITHFYRGVGWRVSRQICTAFVLDKGRVTLSPILFPERFKN